MLYMFHSTRILTERVRVELDTQSYIKRRLVRLSFYGRTRVLNPNVDMRDELGVSGAKISSV